MGNYLSIKLQMKRKDNGLFKLAKFVSETVSDSDMKQYLPWPCWVTQHR